jgi:two-component system, LuxR family, response regulator FixJ
VGGLEASPILAAERSSVLHWAPRRQRARVLEAERTVHVVDDDPGVRRSLERLLYSAGFEHVAYASALAFLEAVPGISAGCVLLDVLMPEINGLDLQGDLNHLGFRLPVVVITGHGDIPTAVQAMKAGAVDFIEKPFDDERLIAAIEAALADFGRGFADREAATEAVERIATLSPRERQVLDALVAGRPSKVIAYDLGISVRTVEVHRARMLERLGIRRLAGAIRLAVLAGLPPNGALYGESRHCGWRQRTRS